MTSRLLLVPLSIASAFALSACSTNYAAEGALVGAAAGAGVGAVTDSNIGRSAAIGAAAGALGGALIRKDGRCYRVDRDGRERRVRCP